MPHVRRLAPYLKVYRYLFLVSGLAAALASAFDGLSLALFVPFFRILFATGDLLPETPTFVEHVTYRLIELTSPLTGPIGLLFTVVVLIAVTLMLKNVLTYAAMYWSRVIEERVTGDLRTSTFNHLLKLRLDRLQKMKPGDLTSRLLSDVDQLRLFLGQGLQTAIRSCLLATVYVCVLFGLDWRLASATMTVALLIAFGLRPIQARIRVFFSSAFGARGRLSAVATESLSGARVVKAYAGEEYERSRFQHETDSYVRDQLHAERYALLASPLGETLGVGIFVLLLAVGVSVGGVTGGLRPEVFVGFAAITLRLLSPLKRLAHFPAMVQQADAAAERVFALRDETALDVDPKPLAPFTRLEHEILFEKVWFRYETQAWVLRGVTLRISRGDVVAIVGASGAGKSTLVDLLPRFIDPTQGNVRFDGKASTDFDRQSLRSKIAMVSQDIVLFNDTIRGNIAYGACCGASLDSVMRAARVANAHEFIDRLPQKYDTVIGERGTFLSGGERQRIAIARALLRDAPILILDEATSALDRESEASVQAAIHRLMEDRTVLVIAHRLATVMKADRIAVLDGGRIVDMGRHDELVSRDGIYRDLHAPALVGPPTVEVGDSAG